MGVKQRILKENNVTSIEQLEAKLKKKERQHKELQEELDKEEERFMKKWQSNINLSDDD